ncbi:MAG: ATP-dependent Clp protease proteolytic subunit, partial [Armatimonadota bacterium]
MMAYPQTGNPEQQQRAGVGGSGPPPPPPQSGSSRTTWILIAGAVVVGMVLLVGMIVMLVAVAGIAGGGDGALSSTGEQVGVITVEGVITASGGQSMFGAPLGGVRQTLDQLKRAEDNDSIKSVVLRINSPGGSAAASQELYHAIRQLADAKP